MYFLIKPANFQLPRQPLLVVTFHVMIKKIIYWCEFFNDKTAPCF